ncbi:MAG: ABC transporter ATP-binding protein [Acidimicrobiales bacterium]
MAGALCVSDPVKTRDVGPGVPRLSAEGLSKHFGGVVALDGVALSVRPGEVVGLLGPNGAGKTTLFNCLLGVEQPDRGRVWVDGKDVTRLEVYERARLGMARTFQRVELFAELTVRQQLAVAVRARSRRGRMLARSGGDRAGRYRPGGDRTRPGDDRTRRGDDRTRPGGDRSRGSLAVPGSGETESDRVDAILGLLGLEGDAEAPAASLSLGRTRLVELGRALATEPSVVLADEPSSGLDDQERSTLAAALPTVTEGGPAVLLIEHDLDLVRQVCGRLLVLDAGSVIASGATLDVLADPVVARAYGRAGSR